LQQQLIAVTVDPDVFPDHAVIWGEFRPFASVVPRQVWKVPQAFPWPDAWDVDPAFWQQSQGTCAERYTALWQHIEHRACEKLPYPVSSHAKGRADTHETTYSTDGKVSPPKLARKGDVQPHFLGATFRHAQWLRQTRRLQSYVRFIQNNSADSLHAKRVWGSIVRAKGFHPSFPAWWQQCIHRTLAAPGTLPVFPPEHLVAIEIFESMQCELRKFESELKSSSRMYARLKRDRNPNAIFQDLKEFQPHGVDLLLHQAPYKILEVRHDDCSIVLDRPADFVSDQPIVSQGRPFSVIHAEHDGLWVDDVSTVKPGDLVTQLASKGTHEELSQMFLNTWKSMWERHTNVPVERWTIILDFARQHLPRRQFQLPVIDVSSLTECLAHKKATTTGGLDGVSLSDLKAMPPDALRNFVDMFHHAEATGHWPPQVVAGRVSCLAKTTHPSRVLDFRPITVLGLLYRCWGTFHARHIIRALDEILPTGLYGSRPHRYAGQVWSHLLWSIEQAYECSIPLCGIIVDIQKAFNFLPRLVVMESCALVGIPFRVLRGWSGALSSMARRFMLNGSLSPPAMSNCGLPEGCALSCVGMMVIDILFHFWMLHFFPMCQPLSYVDDWQVLLTNPALIKDTFRCLERFTQAMDLLLDQRKTHTWSVCREGRFQLREQGLDTINQSRALGAHVQFSRQHTNSTLMARVQCITPLWSRLRLSACGYVQKIRALKSSAWPRCLHGVAATTLSLATFSALRAGALKGIREDASGANAMVHLGLLESVEVDPYGFAIMQTFRLTRDCGVQARVEGVLAAIVQGGSSIPMNCISQTLCTRIQYLGWHINTVGRLHDLIGEFSLFSISAAELQYRVTLQWPRVVSAQVAHRRCFSGLERSDPHDTHVWMKSLDVVDQALFRKLLNGTHITQDGKCHCQESTTDECPFCLCSDSRYHRFWECEQFVSLREHLSAETLETIRDLPEALTCTGWSLHPSTWEEWNQYFGQLVDAAVPDFLAEGDVHLFTDGSCHDQHLIQQRFAGWSVVQASIDAVHDFSGSRILDSGVLPGLLQSSVRAEIYAVWRALLLAQFCTGTVYIWTDCDAVVKRFRKLQSGGLLRTNSAHADLWGEIKLCLDSRPGSTVITRVASHQCPDAASSFLAEWCFRHNGLADKQAVRANFARGDVFWGLHQRHAVACDGIAFYNRAVQRVLLRISQEVMRQNTPVLLEPTPVACDMPVPFKPWSPLPPLQLPAAAIRWYGDPLVRVITSWFWQVVDSAEALTWVSHFQLYVDFMLATGQPGPVHAGQWINGMDMPWVGLRGFSFKQRTRWFTKVLKETLRHQSVSLQMGFGKPASQMILFHTGMIAVPFPLYRLHLIDDWLLRVGGGFTFRRQAKALERLPFADVHPLYPQFVLTSLGR